MWNPFRRRFKAPEMPYRIEVEESSAGVATVTVNVLGAEVVLKYTDIDMALSLATRLPEILADARKDESGWTPLPVDDVTAGPW